MTSLQDKVAVVTGASRGVGAAVARALAGEGAKLALVSRSGGDLGIAGAVARPCDVRDRGPVQALVDEAAETFGAGGVATDFALEEGRGRSPDALPGMMRAEDVAEAVLFALSRPRNHRILEVAFRPMSEGSWG
jgi:NADP-dependent 3-hydroxy acid dehydrogenase YdfG